MYALLVQLFVLPSVLFAPTTAQATYNDNSLLVDHSDQSYHNGPSAAAQSAASSAFATGIFNERNGTDNRKPSFRDCATFQASVREEQPLGVFVIRVQAHDPDANDRIEYSFVHAVNERPKFRIEPKTGNIYTSYQFDRDEPAREKEVSFGTESRGRVGLGTGCEDVALRWQ